MVSAPTGLNYKQMYEYVQSQPEGSANVIRMQDYTTIESNAILQDQEYLKYVNAK